MASMESNETAQVLSDLIKIGIPSLVAIVTAVISAYLALKAHKKDLIIEKLRIADSTKKDLKTRQGELIERIAGDLNTVQVPLIKYGTFVAEDIVSDIKIPIAVEMRQMSISDAYEALSEAVQNGSRTKVDIYLLGNRSLVSAYEEYWQSLKTFLNQCSPAKGFDLDTLLSRHEVVKRKQEVILEALSNMYLGNNYGVPGEL